jgi:hypothetical protein
VSDSNQQLFFSCIMARKSIFDDDAEDFAVDHHAQLDF